MTDRITVESARRVFPDTDEGRIDRTFDAFDGKGRQFGAMVRKFTATYEAQTWENMWETPTMRASAAAMAAKVGRPHYGFRPHAMRGGQLYGASQMGREFDTVAERDAAIEAYFASAEKGALKNKARAK